MTIFDNIIQMSPEWWDVRRGRVTASGMDRIITAVKAAPSSQARKYAAALAAEVAALSPTCFSESSNKPPNQAMKDGQAREPEARKWLEFEKDVTVRQVGFCLHDNALWGCSPDGLIVDANGELVGGLELKCPLAETHAEYFLDGTLPQEYKPQVHGSLIVTGLPVWHFMSYHPSLPPLHVEVRPDSFTEALRKELERFTTTYAEVLKRLLGITIADMLLRLHSDEGRQPGEDDNGAVTHPLSRLRMPPNHQ